MLLGIQDRQGKSANLSYLIPSSSSRTLRYLERFREFLRLGPAKILLKWRQSSDVLRNVRPDNIAVVLPGALLFYHNI